MNKRPSAIVTGAGSGIGRATAIALALKGYDLLMVGRTLSKLEQTAADIAKVAPHIDALSLAVDLTLPESPRQMVAHAHERFGRIDALANVAGAAPLLKIEQITPEIWREAIDGNVSYVVYATAAVWPIFTSQQSGVIVNISSMASVDPFPGFSLYASAKIALNMFTRCTASEGIAIGVRAVCIAPGAVETPMLRSLFDKKTLPPAQAADPAEIGQVVADCITGEHAFESGQTMILTK